LHRNFSKFISIISLIILTTSCDYDGLQVASTGEDTQIKLAPKSVPGCTTSLSSAAILPNITGETVQTTFSFGNMAYSGTSTGTDGIQLINFTDPLNPVNFAHFDSGGKAFLDLTADSTHVYGATITGDIVSVDITNTAAPTEVDFHHVGGQLWGITTKGDYLYAGSSSGTYGLAIIDKSDPTNLNPIATFPAYKGYHLEIHGSTLYMTSNREIFILDLTNPISPSLIGSIDLGASFEAYEIHRAGNFIYSVAKPQELLRVIEITDPANPVVTFTSIHLGDGHDFGSIAGNDSKIYIGTRDGSNGTIRSYDIGTTPGTPVFEEAISATDGIYEVYLHDDNTLISGNKNGDTQVFTVCI
jgi:hypothetical protein